MINNKTDKELAFLQDLFIAPDWGERFAELIDEHVKLPKEGKALYVAAGTGRHAHSAPGARRRETRDCSASTKTPNASNWPRQKQLLTKEETRVSVKAGWTHWRCLRIDFDLVVGNASLIPTAAHTQDVCGDGAGGGSRRDDRTRSTDCFEFRRVLFDLLGSVAQHGPDGSRG